MSWPEHASTAATARRGKFFLDWHCRSYVAKEALEPGLKARLHEPELGVPRTFGYEAAFAGTGVLAKEHAHVAVAVAAGTDIQARAVAHRVEDRWTLRHFQGSTEFPNAASTVGSTANTVGDLEVPAKQGRTQRSEA